MKFRTTILAGLATAAIALSATGPAASASPGISTALGRDVYGATVSTPYGALPSAQAKFVTVRWDTNRQYATVSASLKDTGRGDGKYAGFYAQLTYSDGSNSGWKLVGMTGREDAFVALTPRAFVPVKETVGLQFRACQADRYGTAVGGCGAILPGGSLLLDNPYQNNPWDPYV